MLNPPSCTVFSWKESLLPTSAFSNTVQKPRVGFSLHLHEAMWSTEDHAEDRLQFELSLEWFGTFVRGVISKFVI